MNKEKNCKGINKAHGFEGCGKPSGYRKFGLCPSCLWDWMHTNENGKIYKEKQFLPQVSKKQKQAHKEKTKKAKIELMTPDNYRSTYVQPLINKIARLLDYGHPCIATGNFGKMNGGHYRSVGSNRTLALNLHNIHIQCYESNVFRGGDDKNYKDGLKDLYGNDYFEFVDGLRKHRPLSLSKYELIKIKEKAQKIINRLESYNFMRTPEERILTRNEINLELGVYDTEFSVYELKKPK